LKADDLECKISCSQLCDTVERGDALVLGDGYANVVAVLRVFADVFIDVNAQAQSTTATTIEGYSTTTISRMQNIVRQVLVSGKDVIHTLSTEQQQILLQC
jgi:hypothetical protein